MELHSCQLCPRHAQVGLYLLCVYSVTARQMTWFYLCIHTLPLNTSLEYILLLGAAGTNFVAPPINRCPSSFAFLFSCDRLMAQLLWEGLKRSSNRQVPTQEALCCFAFWRKWVRCSTFWCCYSLYSFCTGKNYYVRLSLCENCLL